MTGGMSYFPRFTGEMPDIFNEINQNIRAKYELIYHPTNAKQDGTFRKLRVELVDDEGQPLRMQDEKHKPLSTTSLPATAIAPSRKWSSHWPWRADARCSLA